MAETTLDVVGKPNDINNYDEIITTQNYRESTRCKKIFNKKKGGFVYVTSPAKNLFGQVIHLSETVLYYFDVNVRQSLRKKNSLPNIEFY